MSRAIKGGSTDQSSVIRFVDSTAGTPEEGVVAATAGLALWYRREGAVKVNFAGVNNLATLDAAHNDEGILHIDDGYYRFDLPDAAVVAGATGVMVGGTATGMVVIGAYHPIDEPADVIAISGDKTAADNLESACDNYSVTRGLTGTALPAVVGGANGGVPLGDANGRVDVSEWLGQTVVATVNGRPVVDMQYILGHLLTQTGTQVADGFEHFFDHATPAITVGDAMRGTNSAALASVVGALADAAAAGDPTNVDTLMQYVKQLINILIGTAGIPVFPAEAAPANDVSLAEVIRAIHADVTGLNGSAMVGTNSAATAAKLLDYIQLLARSDAAINTDNAVALGEINANEGSGAGDFDNQTDSEEAIRNVEPHGTVMRGTDNAALAATALSTVVWTAARAGYLDNINGHTAQTGDNFVRIGATGAGLTSLAQASLVTAARMGALTDWIDGGRLDTILDTIAADVVNIDGAAMRGTDGANTVVPPSVAQFNARTLVAGAYFDHTTDTVDANLIQIMGTVLAGNAAQIAAAFAHFWDVAVPAKDINDVGVAGAALTPAQVWAYATRTLTDKTGFKLASDGIDQIIAEVGTGGADDINARQALAMLMAKAWGAVTRPDEDWISKGANSNVTRGTHKTTDGLSRSDVVLTPPA